MSAKLNLSNLSLLYEMYTVQKSREEKGRSGKKKENAKNKCTIYVYPGSKLALQLSGSRLKT